MKKNVITSAILLAIPALATAEDVAKLDVINVYSASATPTSLHQTASSVTVLTEKDFAQRGATYVSDVCLIVAFPLNDSAFPLNLRDILR